MHGQRPPSIVIRPPLCGCNDLKSNTANACNYTPHRLFVKSPDGTDGRPNKPPSWFRNMARIMQRAFAANFQAKASVGAEREAFYRAKHAAINTLLNEGYAYVDDIEWSLPDPTLSITFIDGGQLHMKRSSLDAAAFRRLRPQLTVPRGRFTEGH